MSMLSLVQQKAEIAPVKFTKEDIELIKQTVCMNSTDAELKLFLHHCARTRLDPFIRQIYSVARWNKDASRAVHQTQVSIDGFRLIAERTGKYAGQVGPFWCGEDGEWKDYWLSSSPPAACKVGILRSDFKEPIWGFARFEAFKQTFFNKQSNQWQLVGLWAKMPEVMTAKCAESQGLRKAFPHELSGLYTSDEMGQAEPVDVNVKVDMNVKSGLDKPIEATFEHIEPQQPAKTESPKPSNTPTVGYWVNKIYRLGLPMDKVGEYVNLAEAKAKGDIQGLEAAYHLLEEVAKELKERRVS